MTSQHELFSDPALPGFPANDGARDRGVSLAGLLCAHCGGEAVEGIALFDTPERRVVALHVPECAAAAGARPWDGRVWT